MKRLAKLGMVSAAPGMAALDMNTAEDAVVHHTREVVEGFVLCGMEVTSYYLPVGMLPDVVQMLWPGHRCCGC